MIEANPVLVGKDNYYKDVEHISFSALKVFSKCETLYRDIFVTKIYEEPEQDYFVYGKLVDAFVTEKPEFVAEHFIRVERKIKPEDALKFENQIKGLQEEIDEKTLLIRKKLSEKEEALLEKLKTAQDENNAKSTPAKEKKILTITGELNDFTMDRDSFADKTLLKGIESRKLEILEIQTSLNMIKELADKQQVTGSVWENAEQTALAIKTHPYYSNMEFNEITSQQIFVTEIAGIPCKGKLDHLKLSPALTKIYAIYKANQMTLPELQARVKEMNPNDLWAIITDIKTCRDIELLEPYNKHYRGQLGFYRELVSSVLCIPLQNIRCMILAADKLSNDFKKCELFEYTDEALNELKGDVWAWAHIWMDRMKTGKFISAKEKDGMKQKCFTCSECRFCPFSMKPGEPVMINGPRFETTEPGAITLEISTADAVLDY